MPVRRGACMSAAGAHACEKGGAHACGVGPHACEEGGAHVCEGCAPLGGRARLRGGGRAWSSLSFGSSVAHFQIKLSIHASNFNSRFVSMGELELFLLTRVLTPNFNTMDLV
jgi:hypothetical protein